MEGIKNEAGAQKEGAYFPSHDNNDSIKPAVKSPAAHPTKHKSARFRERLADTAVGVGVRTCGPR